MEINDSIKGVIGPKDTKVESQTSSFEILVGTKDVSNQPYYDKPVSPTDIIIRKSVSNTYADTLREAVSEIPAK